MNSAACQIDDPKRPTVRSVPGPWRWMASNRRSVSARGAPLHRLHALRPGGYRVVLVEPADVRDRLPEPVERVVGLGVGVDDLRPTRRRRGCDAPVRRGIVDDPPDDRQIRQQIAPRALGRNAVERVRRVRAAERDPCRVLVREVLHPVDHPGRDVGERLRVAVEQPLALHPLVGVPDVDEPSAALVGGAGDLACQLLLAEVARDADAADPAARWRRSRRSGRRAGGSDRSSRSPRGTLHAPQ